jgi:hypothetical protein
MRRASNTSSHTMEPATSPATARGVDADAQLSAQIEPKSPVLGLASDRAATR